MPKEKPLDNIDIRILRALQKNGRLHNNELAQEIGLSNSACLRRVNILEENEIIDHYTAILNPQKLHCPLSAYVFGSFIEEDNSKRERFIFEMKLVPNIVECHLMAGDYDFVVKIRAADLDEFHRIKTKYLNKELGVKNVKSEIVLQTIKESTELPL